MSEQSKLGDLFGAVLDAPQSMLIKFVDGKTTTKSVVGIPFIGKSTLAHDCKDFIRDNRSDFFSIYLTMHAFKSSSDFCKGFYDEICAEIIKNDVPEDVDFIEEESEQKVVFKIRSLLETVKRKHGKCCVVLLDHFDAVIEVESSDYIIRVLRQLVDRGREHGAKFVFFSRRELANIEYDVLTSSIFGITGKPVYIRPMEMSAELLATLGTDVCHVAGGHPYLSELAEDRLDDMGAAAIDAVYEKIFDALTEDFLDNEQDEKLLAQRMRDHLERLGVWRRSASGAAFFSEGFGEYFTCRMAQTSGNEILGLLE
ncbi:hypothetical protein [Tateyamaria sp.]|uniref:hypothetical protein n=1 Tax=Tateyamaria sp. TaxID=1929288 RepID=UPI00329B3C21